MSYFFEIHMVVCRIRKWVYGWMAVQVAGGIVILFTISAASHRQWFDKDPIGYMFSMLIIVGVFEVFPLVLFKWLFQEVIFDDQAIKVKTFLPVSTTVYPRSELRKWHKEWYNAYQRREALYLVFSNGKKISFTRMSNTNFDAARKHLELYYPA